MSKWISLFLSCSVLLFAVSSLAITGIPDVSLSHAWIAFPGPGMARLMVVPDGSGPGFSGAHDEQGNPVDATITLVVLDGLGSPIMNYPWEDIWLASADGGMVPCFYGVPADQNTDASGMTMWANPPHAGGYSPELAVIYIAATPLVGPGLPLNFNSPDINGDLVVNLQDIAVLSNDYYTGYNFRCDLNGDGILNLLDIPLFARHYGAQCP